MKRLPIIIICTLLLSSLCFAQPAKVIKRHEPIKLPSPDTKGKITVEQAIKHRRNIRDFTDEPLRLEQIAQLAWAGQGITDEEKGFRAAPSAGAIYPMQLHIVLPDGLYRYDPESHSITKTIDRDIRRNLYSAAFAQPVVAKALCSFVISGSARKVEAKYRNNGQKFISIEAGHIAQNLQLQAVAIGLGSATIGGLDPKNVAKACNLKPMQEALYIICVGYPTEALSIVPVEKEQSAKVAEKSKTKRAVFIIASKRFNDNELFDTDMILDIAEIETTIASSKLGTIRGMDGQKVEATLLVKDIVVDDYDAVIFIGGVGVREYLQNNDAIKVAQEAARKGKILAAIGIAPSILARAGVIRGKRIAAFYSERRILTKAGADWTTNDIERDGQFITARGDTPSATGRFGKEILTALRGR